jgi:AmmeMemoRadiSam system protein A
MFIWEMYNKKNSRKMKKYEELLKLARDAIESYLNKKELKISESIKKKYSKKKACFVTLTENGELRGCIGSLSPRQELYKDVIENAIHAAFDDYRFSPLDKNEFPKIRIEISVLSIPKKIGFKNEKELLEKISNKMGIILEKEYNSATFLPQVWEELPDKKNFLEHLSLKAGLEKNAWKSSDIYFYEVDSVEEK